MLLPCVLLYIVLLDSDKHRAMYTEVTRLGRINEQYRLIVVGVKIGIFCAAGNPLNSAIIVCCKQK